MGKMINKKFAEITKCLSESSKDLRVQYLIVFEEGRLEWYGDYQLNTEQNVEEKVEEKMEDEMPLHAPIQTYTNSTESIGISVIDVDMNVIRKYGRVDSEDDKDSQSGYDGSEREDSMIIHSDDTDDDIKQFIPTEDDEDVIKENEAVSNQLDDKEIIQKNVQKIEKNEDEKKDKMKNIKKNLENIKIEKIANDEKIKKDEIEIEEKKKLVQMKESVDTKKEKKKSVNEKKKRNCILINHLHMNRELLMQCGGAMWLRLKIFALLHHLMRINHCLHLKKRFCPR